MLGSDWIHVDCTNFTQANDYGFRYSVNDFSGNEHSHQQQKVGHVVRGQYKVLLPDGRLQTVTYVADENGYRAKVDYTPARPGEATTAGIGGPPFEAQPPVLPPVRPPALPPVFFGRTSVELDPQAEQLAAVAAPSEITSETTSSTNTPSTSSTTTAPGIITRSNISVTQRAARRYFNSPALQDWVVRPSDPYYFRQGPGRMQYPSYYGAGSQLKFSAYPYAYTQHS